MSTDTKCKGCEYPIYEGEWCRSCQYDGRWKCHLCSSDDKFTRSLCSAHRPKHSYLYPKADIVVDIVVVAMERPGCSVPSILLIKRKGDPFKGCWALPGGYLNIADNITDNETLEEAAHRELLEETGVKVTYDGLRQLGTYSDPQRDPRGRTISTAFWGRVYGYSANEQIKAGDDAAEVAWIPVPDLKGFELAFDHRCIILDFLDECIYKTYNGTWMMKNE